MFYGKVTKLSGPNNKYKLTVCFSNESDTDR